jgi:hypothetical protein
MIGGGGEQIGHKLFYNYFSTKEERRLRTEFILET